MSDRGAPVMDKDQHYGAPIVEVVVFDGPTDIQLSCRKHRQPLLQRHESNQTNGRRQAREVVFDL
jgi:hypothetical protein